MMRREFSESQVKESEERSYQSPTQATDQPARGVGTTATSRGGLPSVQGLLGQASAFGNQKMKSVMKNLFGIKEKPDPPPPAQSQFSTWTNRDTKRTFVLEVDDEHGVRAKERAQGEVQKGRQRGNATWEVKNGILILKTIVATPQEGTGLGALMMFFLAEAAAIRKCEKIEILSAAPTAVGFYLMMGAEAGDPDAIKENLEEYGKVPENKTWNDITWKAAEVRHEKENYEKEGYIPFDDLSLGEKRDLVEKEAKRLYDKKPDLILKQRENQAISSLGVMYAKTETVQKRALEQINKKWVQVGN